MIRGVERVSRIGDMCKLGVVGQRLAMRCRYFFFQAEDGIRDPLWSRGLGDVYKGRLRCLHDCICPLACCSWKVTVEAHTAVMGILGQGTLAILALVMSASLPGPVRLSAFRGYPRYLHALCFQEQKVFVYKRTILFCTRKMCSCSRI